MGALRESVEQTKDVLVEDLALTMKRGQLLEQSKDKSEQLMETSYTYKKKAKKVEMTMCMRKWIWWIVGVLAAIIVGVILYFYFKN